MPTREVLTKCDYKNLKEKTTKQLNISGFYAPTNVSQYELIYYLTLISALHQACYNAYY